MPRFRSIALLVGALVLLWLRPWRRLARRDQDQQRPQWFDEPAREFSETAHRASASAATYAGGFSSGQAGNPAPAPRAQPAPPPVEAALDALATPAPEPPAEGPLSFEVLDDMQGQHGADSRTAQPSSAITPATAASAAHDLAPAPVGVGSTTNDDAPAPAPHETPQRDDLIIIEGIGPKANLIMEGAGITSFAQLADTPVETLRQLLRENGISTLDPHTWPEQARLAANGRMDDLRELQGRIKNGRLEG